MYSSGLNTGWRTDLIMLLSIGFLPALASASEAVNVRYQWRPQLSDANDEMLLEAAVNGRADALMTHNIKDFKAAATKFNLRILLPADVLAERRK